MGLRGARLLPALSGTVPLVVFLVTWMVSAFAVPVAALLSFSLGWHGLSMALALYYAYRLFFKLRKWEWVHAIQMRLCDKHHYFRTQKTVLECTPIAPSSKALLGWHPHGILCIGWILNGNIGKQLFSSKCCWLTAPILFKLPLLSEMLTWYNCAPSSAASMKSLMKRGENIALIPGGFQEATMYQFNSHIIYLKKRKGFIKYALQHGYKVYPCYTFGEERTYFNIAGLHSLRLWLNKYHIPTVLFVGKCLMLPFPNVDLVSVIGKPLELPTIAQPSAEDVRLWHDKYMKALQDVFERNKSKYAHDPEAKLHIK